MGNGLLRLSRRFLYDPGNVDTLKGETGKAMDAAAADEAGLVTFTPDDIDWEDEVRLAVEERAGFSPNGLIGMEAKLEVQKNYSTGAFSGTRQLEQQIAALRNRISMIAGAGGTEMPERGSGLLITFARMPGLGRQLADLLLTIKTQQAVFTLLTTQFQQAKIEEARDIPTIQVLDRARPPVTRDSPRRKKNMMAGFAVGVGGGILLAFGLQYLYRTMARIPKASPEVQGRVGPGFRQLEIWLARLRS